MPMERSRKFRIEELSKPKLMLAWGTLFVLFALAIFVAGVFAPEHVFDRHCKRWFRGDEDTPDSPVTPMMFLINRDPIDHLSPSFTNWNQDFFFYLTLYRRPKFQKNEGSIGFEIFPFKLYIAVIDPSTSLESVTWTLLRPHERHLDCPRSSLNTTRCPKPTDGNVCIQSLPASAMVSGDEMCGMCRVTLAHETFLSSEKPVYRIAVKVVNAESHKWQGLMEKDVFLLETMYKYSSEEFTLFEMYFRYILVFASLVVTVVFWIQNRYFHAWSEWALEQKWTFLLLLSLVMFNNPLFFLNIWAEAWVFPFLNVVFINNFLIMYLLCILLFTDNLYKSHRRASNFTFYVPKLVLLGSLWFVGIVSFAVTRMQQKANIAENDIENVEVNGYEVFKMFTAILLGIYMLWLFYLMVRVISQWSGDVTVHIARRVKVLWFAAILMLGGIVLGEYQLVLQRNDSMQAVQFFGIFAMYNFFTYFLSFMYWPVTNRGPGGVYHPAPARVTAMRPTGGGAGAGTSVTAPMVADVDAIFDDDI